VEDIHENSLNMALRNIVNILQKVIWFSDWSVIICRGYNFWKNLLEQFLLVQFRCLVILCFFFSILLCISLGQNTMISSFFFGLKVFVSSLVNCLAVSKELQFLLCGETRHFWCLFIYFFFFAFFSYLFWWIFYSPTNCSFIFCSFW